MTVAAIGATIIGNYEEGALLIIILQLLILWKNMQKDVVKEK